MSDISRPALLVSACLLGLPTRFDGGGRERPDVSRLGERFVLVPVCPEQLGGLPTPRPPAEIQSVPVADGLGGGPGGHVVATVDGVDVSGPFAAGAQSVVRIAEIAGASGAVLKARSPSCGVGETYDGSFTCRVRPGDGVTAAALRAAGLELWTEEMVSAGCGPAADDEERGDPSAGPGPVPKPPASKGAGPAPKE